MNVIKPARPEMSEQERKRLGLEDAREFEAFVATEARARKEADAAQAEIHRLQRVLDDLAAAGATRRDGYVARRDERHERLWAGRPALADDLIAQVEDEARSLQLEHFDLPSAEPRPVRNTEGGELANEAVGAALADMPRTVSNAASVNLRRRALFGLAETIREATTKGTYGSVAELQAMFDRGYRSLPVVERIDQVLMQDVRGKKFAALVKAHRDRTPPPAA